MDEYEISFIGGELAKLTNLSEDFVSRVLSYYQESLCDLCSDDGAIISFDFIDNLMIYLGFEMIPLDSRVKFMNALNRNKRLLAEFVKIQDSLEFSSLPHAAIRRFNQIIKDVSSTPPIRINQRFDPLEIEEAVIHTRS